MFGINGLWRARLPKKRTLEHLEYINDLRLSILLIEKTEQVLQSLKTIFNKYAMGMAYNKTAWMYVDADVDQSPLQINYHNINQVSSFSYLGSPVNGKGLADNAVKLNFIKAKRQLIKLSPILWSKVLSTKTRAKISVTLTEPVILYGLSTIVYHERG